MLRQELITKVSQVDYMNITDPNNKIMEISHLQDYKKN